MISRPDVTKAIHLLIRSASRATFVYEPLVACGEPNTADRYATTNMALVTCIACRAKSEKATVVA